MTKPALLALVAALALAQTPQDPYRAVISAERQFAFKVGVTIGMMCGAEVFEGNNHNGPACKASKANADIGMKWWKEFGDTWKAK